MSPSSITDHIRQNQVALGHGILRLRLQRNLPQLEAARRAGVSERAWRNLENGRGSTVETVLRALETLDALSVLNPLLLPPEPTANQPRVQRASRRRKPTVQD